MNLVIDSGNTSLKAGIFEKSELKELIAGIHVDELQQLVKKYPFQHAAISSVNQQANMIAEKAGLKSVLIIDQHTRLPFRNLYKTPATLGTDRLAAVAGAISLFPGKPCLAIDAGTCITFDYIDTRSNYSGGSIAPGINLRFKAMHNFTARLPLVERNEQAPLVGSNTEESLQSGVMRGTAAEMDGMIAQYREREPDIKVIICGGDARFFETNLKQSIFVVPELVLIGLNRILEHNVAEL